MNHTTPVPVPVCTPEPFPWSLVATKVVVIVLIATVALYALHLGHDLAATVTGASALGYAAAEALRRLRLR